MYIFLNGSFFSLIKRKCNAETFIDWLHALMYMDDTVLLATTRAAMLSKITIFLYDFSNEYGMKVNLAKTKFFVINGGAGDADPNDLIVEHCSSYVYFGCYYTCEWLGGGCCEATRTD